MSSCLYIYPTDTVWGIGASIDSQEMTLEISKIKQTDPNKPLSILFSSLNQLRQYVQLPAQFDDQWLKKFFSLESTLAVPRSLTKGRIPSWILGDSDLVAVRCLELPGIQRIINEVATPITTTSFNISGTPSIQEREAAHQLFQKIAPHAQFIDDRSAPLSGNASSILKISLEGEMEFLRKGNCWQEIMDHVHLLST